jgi:hypothetical protein
VIPVNARDAMAAYADGVAVIVALRGTEPNYFLNQKAKTMKKKIIVQIALEVEGRVPLSSALASTEASIYGYLTARKVNVTQCEATAWTPRTGTQLEGAHA